MKTCLLALAVLILVTTSKDSRLLESKRIVCYVGTDSSTRLGRGSFHLNDLNARYCTHVIFGFLRLRSERVIEPLVSASWAEFMKGTNMTIFKRKFPGVKFMVGLGGWYNGVQVFYKSAESKEHRKTLSETALDFVKQNNFDGLELCWLYPTKRGGFLSDRKNFVELLKSFKVKFEENNLIFTVLLGGSYTTIDAGYDVKEIFKIVDFADIISYDYNGFWSYKIAPNAPLYSQDKSNINYTVQHFISLGAHRNKIVIGIPFYGRTFFVAPGNPKPNLGDAFDKDKERLRTFMGPYTRDESGAIAYNEICLEQTIPDKWEERWDNQSQTPYLVTNDKLISYENMTSVEIKLNYVFHEGLGGVMIFSVDEDDFRGDCLKGKFPMLRNLNRVFKRNVEKYKESQSQCENATTNSCEGKITDVLVLKFSVILTVIVGNKIF